VDYERNDCHGDQTLEVNAVAASAVPEAAPFARRCGTTPSNRNCPAQSATSPMTRQDTPTTTPPQKSGRSPEVVHRSVAIPMGRGWPRLLAFAGPA
jgi:hypothetical protein